MRFAHLRKPLYNEGEEVKNEESDSKSDTLHSPRS